MLKLKDLRKERNLTQRELARALNVSQGTISNWEGNQLEISGSYLIRIATFFDVTVDELVGYNKESENVD